jgi:hypothetical protein
MLKYFYKLSIFTVIFITASTQADWQRITSLSAQWVNDIHVAGSVIYIATGNNGIYKSTDGTISWVQISNGLSNAQAIQCNQVILFGGNLYAATVDGMYKSTDLGANWVKKSSGITIGPGGIYEFCESVYELSGVLYTGAFNGIYRSTNSAESWVITNISGMHIWAKNFTMHNGTLFAAREVSGVIGYKSTNDGVTWSPLTTLSFPTITFFSEPGKLFAGTIHGAWLSTNNGTSWVHRMQGLTPDPYNSSFIRVAGTLVTSLKFGGSGIYKTTNDGVLWENFGQGMPFLASIEELVIFNNKMLAATSGGIYERNTSEVTGVSQISNEVPGEYSLSQNYPNPFNPETKIVYSIPKASGVTVKLYDASGREVQILVNQNQGAGTYEISFNASALASGMYYYSMEAGEFTETKKMVLIK